ncbi:DUF748 domain-containing protein [Photobacterium sp.]|uniref:DUF748 domain-containing protein n=1 Tax=Photobacterium sp. TaxID=660 RepID=UPI00299E3321|nr:DUF748 domain-containing protein [Photobacterium sp.]MDX1301014.1 DUF748 domain-containing protein [Photobacterium sp.]
MKIALINAFNRFKQAPKSARALTYLLLTYTCYALLLGLLVPALIQSQAPKKLSELLGRDVRIAEASINPFLLRARISGVEISEQNRPVNFVSLQQLELEFSFWRSLLQLTPSLDHLHIEQPQINIVRLATEKDAAEFNFSDILKRLTAQQSEEPQPDTDQAPSGIPAFRARAIEIVQGSFSFQDQQTGANLQYQGLTFSLQQLDSQALTLNPAQNSSADKQIPQFRPEANRYAFAVKGADQGLLQLEGQFQLQPLEVRGELTLAKVTLPPFWPFAAKSVKAKLSSGEINVESSFHLKQEQEQFSFDTDKGSFVLANLAFNDNETPKVKLPQLVVDGIALSSTSQTVDLHALQVQGIWVDASLNDNGLDLQQLFMPAGAKATEDSTPGNADEAAAKDWLIRLNSFEMADTDLNLTENLISQGVHWRIYPLTLSTSAVLSDLSQPLDYQLALSLSSDTKALPLKDRGQFSSSGSLDAKTLGIDGKLQLTALDLSQFQPYLESFLNLQLSSGSLTTGGDFSADHRGKVVYQGQAAIDDLLIKDRLEYQPLLKWQQMSIDALLFDLQNKQVKIDNLTLDAPYAKVLIAKDRRTNISEILVTETKTPADATLANRPESETVQMQDTETTQSAPKTTEPQAEQAFALDIGSITIAKGSAYFADNSLTPNFASGIESLEGHISHLSSTPGTKAQVDLKGKIDKYAPMTLSGEINPLLQSPYLDLDLVFNSVELTSVNPYSGTYVGYYIDKGLLSLALNYQLENNQLKGSNHLVIDQLQLGKPSESDLATSLPLSLAIALLQDRHGVIDLGLEVSGDIDSPDFSFGSIIMNTITNVITKAVTAPFSLLADLAGTDEELSHVQFRPGLASLDTAEQDRLSKLAKALDDRPILKVSIEGSVALADDSKALAEEKLQQELLQLSGLASLPQDLSASRFPASGPLATALESLFVHQLKLDINAERAKVEQLLKEKASATDAEPEAAQVTTVLHIGMYNQLLNAQEISHNELGNLAEARARTVKAFMVNDKKINPERVFLLDSKSQLNTEESRAVLTLTAD